MHIKIYYYYFSQNELWEKYENIINKVKQKKELTDTEALDIASISKFILKEHAPSVIESLAKVFKKAIIKDGTFENGYRSYSRRNDTETHYL